MNKLKMHSNNQIQSNVEMIEKFFPSCMTESIIDGKMCSLINFELLKQQLLDSVIESDEEKYLFSWTDKKKSILLANSPTNKTLRPCYEESVDFDSTQNLYIEGDNLDVLKLLQETYMGRVKMIYIDPPYNTGTDLVYEDDFAMTIEEYLEYSMQEDEQGNRLFQNTESNGRFHTDWLNMIYPRLKISKELLSEDGVIFISIDDNEMYNCKKICDEVFGAANFICNFIRKNKAGSGHDSSQIAVEFDYVLCYAKDKLSVKINKEQVDTESDGKYRLEDEYIDKRGRYYLRDLDYRGNYSETGDYPITCPDGSIVYSGGSFGKPNTWRWSKKKFEWGLNKGFIVFKHTEDKWKVYIKQYQFVDNNDESYVREIPYRALLDFSNAQGSQECTELLGSNIFSYPKPTGLLVHLMKIATNKDSFILDFFSGSATTADAILRLNTDDGGNRKFICVQLPEQTDERSEAFVAGYKNICEIGKERIRRAGKKMAEVNQMTAPNLDIGFRVLKLDSSNMKDVYYRAEQYSQNLLERYESNIKEERVPQDLLFQIMLDMGVLLSSKIEEKEIAGKKVFIVGEYANNIQPNLIACFDENLNNDVVTAIAKMKPLYAVFRDSSFASDSVATNFEQIFTTYSPTTERKVI